MAVHFVIEAAGVTEIVAAPVPAPEGRLTGATIDTFATLDTFAL